MNTNAIIGIVVIGGALIAYSASKGNDELADATTTSGSSGSGATTTTTTTTTTTDDQTTTDDDDDTSDGSTSGGSGGSTGGSNGGSTGGSSTGGSTGGSSGGSTGGTGDGSGTPEAQPASYDCGNYDPDDSGWHRWSTGTKKTKDTNTCANGVNWRNFKTDKKAYVQGETVNYEFEIDVKEWNPTKCGTSWGTWKQCWFSPDTDGSMGKNDADAEWGVTFFDHTGQEMHRLRTSGASSTNAYKKGKYLKIEGSFVIPNSQAAIGEWKANVFAMIPSYSNNLGISCGTLKAEENNIRVFYCYAKECKDGASAETQTLGAENNANLWMSSFANQTFMAFQ